MTVTPVNDAPTLSGALVDATVGAEGGSIDLSGLLAADVDGTPTLAVRLASGDPLPDGLAIVDGALVVPANLSGTLALEIVATDGELVSAPVALTVTIEPAVNGAPSAPALDGAAVAENAPGAIIGALSSIDPEGESVTFSVSSESIFELAGDVLKLKDGVALDFEAGTTVTATVTATDAGGNATPSDIVVAVGNVDEAPSAVAIDGATVDENVAGAVVGTLSAQDPEGDAPTFSVADARFEVVGNQLKLKDGTALDHEAGATVAVDVTATDGADNATTTTLDIAVNDVDEGGPVAVLFNAATLVAYSAQDRPGDGGAVSVADGGASITLDGNFWKRAPLGESYTVTENSKLVVEIKLGAFRPELVAIGFDNDNDPFEAADKSVFLLQGTESQAAFVDLRGSGVDLGNGVFRFTIDLSGKAGTVIDSLVLVADDDRFSNGRGSVTFSNVTLVEDPGEPDGNTAPREVGGGVADFEVSEGATVEVDIPVVDDDGDALSFTVTVTDAGGAAVTDHGLSIVDGVLGGTAPTVPGAYTVTLTASDGTATTNSDFVLTVTNANDAPMAESVALEPYFLTAGSEAASIDLAEFEEFFSDPDGDALVLSAEGLPAGLSVNQEGVIVGVPSVGGTFPVTIRATDPSGASATLQIELRVDSPAPGDVVTVEAEAFTGRASATNFVPTGQSGASGDRIIRANSAAEPSSITTDLSRNGLVEGWYTVAMTFFDETDASATYSLTIGDAVLASDAPFDGAGIFDNPGAPRGGAGQLGNLKTVTYDTAVYVSAGTILTLSGQANGELLRTDKFTFTRVEAPNAAPIDVTLGTAQVAENADGAVVGALSAVDPDGASGAITFSVDPASDFEIVAGQLKLKDGVAFDFEATPSVDVVVTATDAGGASVQATLSVTVTNVNEAAGAPTLTPANVAENSAGVTIGTLSATDPEGGSLTFTTATPGFEVVNGALKLVDGTALDFEAGATVTVSVTVDDGVSQTTGDVVVTVADVNDAPTLADGAALLPAAVAFGAGGTVDLSVLGATDQDAGDAPTYAVRSATATPLPAGFVVDGNALVVPTDAAAGVYEITVFATDGQADSDSVLLTVTVGEPAPFEPVVIQAEAGTITLAQARDASSTQVRDAGNPETGTTPLRPDFSGTGYLDYGNDGGDTVTYSVTVAAAGSYDISIRYASQDIAGAPRALNFALNGGAAQPTAFPATGPASGPVEAQGFNVWGFLTKTVVLQAGVNTFTLAIPTGVTAGPNLDRIEVTEGGSGPIPVDVPDTSADEDGNLVFDGPAGATLNDTQAASINLNVSGLDDDIGTVAISFDGGATRTDVTGIIDADGDFVVDGSALPAGPATVTVFVTDATGNEATRSFAFTIAGAPVDPGAPIVIQAEDATQVTVQDTGMGNLDQSFTREVNAANPDAFGNYRAGAAGGAYVDFGTNPGDAITITVDAPAAGRYDVTFRYANGDGASADRPLDLSVNGTANGAVAFGSTGTGDAGWVNWTDITVTVDLAAGANTLSLAVPAGAVNGPNIDQITFLLEDDGGPIEPGTAQTFTDVVKINFEAPTSGNGTFNAPAGYTTPAGYESDTGAAYGDRGNGFSYGWVDVENGAVTATPLAQPTGSARYKNDVPGASDLQKTYMHFEYPGASAATNERAFELAIEDGTYEVTLSIGDTGGRFDSEYVINVEGQRFLNPFTPVALDGTSPGHAGQGAYDASLDGQGFRSTVVTGVVQVTDGRLTIDSIGGDNTEIQWLEVQKIPDLTPDDGRSAELDYSFFIDPVAASQEDGQVSIAIGPNGELPLDIDPTSSFVVGVNLQAPGHRGPNISHVDGIKLVETLTGVQVAIDVQITGGADSLTIRPLADLKENTSYTLLVEDVLDLGDVSDATAPLRQLQDLTTTFVTGEKTADVAREVAFVDTVQVNGFADGAGGYTSLEMGPDGKLYVATITGYIHRFDVNEDGTVDVASQETLYSDYFQQFAGSSETAEAQGEGRRSIIGIAFDPEDPSTIWITDNWPVPRVSKAFDTPEFSGQISKVTLGARGSLENAAVETYITGLPRSGGDHVTNSVEFRANPDAGQPGEPNFLLYLTQGSNSAAGEKDNAWGFRPEKLLSAAVLEVDRSRDAPPGGFDVRTEPISLTDNPITDFPESSFNADGTYPGSYNPFADGAVLTLYAVGVRNAYDLVWHSNGHLYTAANGTAAGGRSPDNPNTPQNEGSTGDVPKQVDYLFDIEEGGYYGHANPRTGHYILNGGNPTSGVDKNEVGGNTYYAPGTLPEPDYDIDGSYSLGFNKSPNGATEYSGNAFGANLKGALLFVQFSTGDNVRYVTFDSAGNIVSDDVLRRPGGDVIDDYIDPLDIIENPVTGQLYMLTLNRGTGESKIVLLTPAPGGVTADLTADEGNNLTLSVVDSSDPNNVVFTVSGLDADIETIRVAFNGGPATTIALDANGRFTANLSAATGEVTAVLTVTDDAANTATAGAVVTPGGSDGGTLIDATQFTILSTLTGAEATLVRRIDVPSSYEPTGGNDLNGDGLNDGYDGLGYLDPNGAPEAKASFSFDAPAAGTYTFTFRMANGSATQARPIAFSTEAGSVTIADTRTGGFTTWTDFPVVLTLVQGANTITITQTGTNAPNIDSVLVTALDVVQPDTTADEGGDLAVSLVSAEDPANAVFAATGNDPDIVSYAVSFDDAEPVLVTLDADGRFTADIRPYGSTLTVELTVVDDAGNTTSAVASVAIGDGGNDGEVVVGGVTYVTYEAENATLNGPVVVSETVDDRGAEGTGYVDFNGTTDQSITFDITVAQAGTYSLDFLYALSTAKTARPLTLSVDGNVVTTLPFAPNSNQAENQWGLQSASLVLTAGAHTITVTAPLANGPNIDQLRITKAPVDGVPADVTADVGGDLALTVVDSSDAAAVTFAVSGLDADIQTITVSFDGGATSRPVTLANGRFTADLTGRSGAITATLVVRDDDANTANATAGFTLEAVVPNDGTEVVDGVPFTIYEAETATLGGDPAIVTTAVSDRGQSGGAFVDPTTTTTDTITWTVSVAEDGDYQVDILYALAAGKPARPMPLSVDGTVVETLPFTANSNIAEDAWGPATATLTLTAGVHTISVSAPGGNGPNIDYLRLSAEPVVAFDPDYAAIDGEGRIELEATDGSTRTVGDSTAEFYFTVASDGFYALDLAANAGAPNGGGLTLVLTADGGTAVEIADEAFPGVGDAGETTSFAALQAGVNYKLTVKSDAPGASALDYLDVRIAPGDENADIAVQSLDPAFFDNRLHFNWIDNPQVSDEGVPLEDRDFKESGTVRFTNEGTAPLQILDVDLTGPFTLANPAALDGLTLGAGQSIDVTVLFDRVAFGPARPDGASGVFEGALTLRTNDADSPVATVDLAGFWQPVDEGGREPNVNEVWEVFGFGNFIEGLGTNGGGENSVLNFFDLYIAVDETEVLSPYFQIADGVTTAKITQIAAFHGPGSASLAIHNPSNVDQTAAGASHGGTQNQSILPTGNGNGGFTSKTFTNATIPDAWTGDDAFGLKVTGLSSNPNFNPTGSGVPRQADMTGRYEGFTVTNGNVFDPDGNPVPDGYTVRIFQAVDANGAIIANTYLGVMDYTGINYDYNDNMFVIEGVTAVGFGSALKVGGLDDAAAGDRLVFTSIDNPANGTQLFRNEATITLTNDGFAPTVITGITFGGANAGDFVIVGTPPTTLAAGASAQVTIRYVGTDGVDDNRAVLDKATLTITTDNSSIAPKVIELAGLAQLQSENGEEPTVAQIVEAFGYTTDVAESQLANGGMVETVGDEVLLPYFERLDGSKPVEVIQLAAFLNQGNVARLSAHGLSSDDLTQLFAADDQQGQTILPDGLVPGAGNTGSVARASFNPDGAFGLKVTVDGRPTYASWTDPEANEIDPNFGQLVDNNEGHLIRFFEAKDADGHVIAGTYIGIQDYPGAGNYDYNDHMFVIKNVKGHTLTAVEDGNSDGINDALQTDADGDGVVAFFDGNDTPSVELDRGAYVVGFNVGGPAVASQQGLGGVALRADNDPLIKYAGDGATRAPGQDLASNLNGANALPGAFKTYRDGTNWTTEVSGLKDGEYVVVLHTQETYFNAAGQRVFDLKINGVTVADNLDPFVAAGGGDKVVSIEALVQVVGGKFTVGLDTIGGDRINNAALNAITVFASGNKPGGGLAGVGNDAPTADPVTGVPSATEGQAFSFNVAAFFDDPDGDALTFSANGLPAGLTITPAGLISGTPTADGTFTVAVTASDGSLSTAASFALTVADTPAPAGQTPFPGPNAPTFAGGILTVDASNYDNGGQGVAYNDAAGLQGGTNGGRAGSSVEQTTAGDIGWIATGEWLEYTITAPTAGLYDIDLLLATSGAGRSATVAFYRPGAATPYETALIGNPSTGSYTTFLTRSADGIELEAGTQVVRITFSGGGQDFRSFTLTAAEDPNAAPTTTGIGAQDADENEAFTLDVSAAFSDPDGDALAFTATGLPAGLSISNAGIITGVPTADGDFTIAVTASDGTLSVTSSFALNVAAEPPAPTQTPFPGPNAPLLGASLTVDATNFDAGGQGISWNDDAGKAGGNIAVRPATDVELVGPQDDIGYVRPGEWVEYTVNVARAGTYTLSVNAKTPIGGNGMAVSLADGTPLGTIALADANAVGNNSFDGTNFSQSQTIQVDLAAGQQTLRFTFGGQLATNGFLLDLRSFTLTEVPPAPVNRAPTTGGISDQGAGEGESFTLNVSSLFSDPDGDALSFSASGLPAGLSISAAGVISGTPTEDGTFAVTVRASDGSLVAGTTFDLAVAPFIPPNSAPVTTGIAAQTADENQAYSLNVSQFFSDPDGDGLTFTATGLPGGLSISPAGVLSGTPLVDGNYAVTVTASDGEIGVATGFQLTVNNQVIANPFGATSGNDTFDGTNGNDLIDALGGNDFVRALNGSDTMIGGAGNDTLKGDGGDDMISGGVGSDSLYGGGLADTLNGGEGNDKLFGGSGSDVLFGDAGNDTLKGDSEDDVFTFDLTAGPSGIDVIVDFALSSTQEVIRLIGTGIDEFADLSIANNAKGEAVITFGAGSVVTLTGVSASSLTANDLDFLS